MQFGIPVNQALAAIDQAIFMQANKGFLNGAGEAFIHGEAFGIPVNRVAETTHLLGNGATRFFFPLPDLLNKLLTAHLFAAGLTFGGQFALNHHLRGDTGMVGAHLPQGIFALHAVVSG